MEDSMLGFPLGALFGVVTALITRRALSSLMAGRTAMRVALMIAKTLLHGGFLTAMAFVSVHALLWAAVGDTLALIGFAVYEYRFGKG